MRDRPHRFSIWRVDIGHDRRVGSAEPPHARRERDRREQRQRDPADGHVQERQADRMGNEPADRVGERQVTG